ncbi:unnamed protein product [Durusdinium trenchii]|uniref:Uncharacterized protein n=1 Tax=Durusdinium trenchii TaxID=1381693 RepID=A0ABP0LEF0_9DINO
MGAYGSECAKPTVLYSNYRFIQRMYAPLPRKKTFDSEMANKYQDWAGCTRVKGGVDLKSSQHYPPQFGEAIMEGFLDNYKFIKEEVKKNQKDLLKQNRKELKDWSNLFPP